jgi:hypothetical protein
MENDEIKHKKIGKEMEDFYENTKKERIMDGREPTG